MPRAFAWCGPLRSETCFHSNGLNVKRSQAMRSRSLSHVLRAQPCPDVFSRLISEGSVLGARTWKDMEST